MQLIQLERDDWTLFCPASGVPVFTETGDANAETIRGIWFSEVADEPSNLAAELQVAWQAYRERQEAADESPDVADFLRSVEQPGWVAFEISSCGMACGPVWSTTWVVLDLS